MKNAGPTSPSSLPRRIHIRIGVDILNVLRKDIVRLYFYVCMLPTSEKPKWKQKQMEMPRLIERLHVVPIVQVSSAAVLKRRAGWQWSLPGQTQVKLPRRAASNVATKYLRTQMTTCMDGCMHAHMSEYTVHDTVIHFN